MGAPCDDSIQRPRPAAGALRRARREPHRAGVVLLCLALAACGDGGKAAVGGADAAPPSTAASATPTISPSAAASSSAGDAAEAPDADTPSSWGPTLGELDRAEELSDGMSLTDLADQVLMPGFWGYDAEQPSAVEADANQVMHGAPTAAEALASHAFGGVFLRPEVISDATQVGLLTGTLRGIGDRPDSLPLLVSIDQEGGTVQRLRYGVEAIPSASYVGSTGDPSYAREVARDNGESLRSLGVTMVMAPVADVDPGGVSALGTRTYSSDPGVAASMVVATVRGYLDAGVLPVVKHFPGLGSVTGDSHLSLPVQDKALAELTDSDLVPFAAAVEAGAPVVMAGHVSVEALDAGLPASVSRPVLTDLLRDRLGFEGVVVTDSQGMGPIDARFGSGEGAVRSLLAGDDLVLNSPRPVEARLALVQAVLAGRVPEERLREAAARVLALRMYAARIAAVSVDGD